MCLKGQSNSQKILHLPNWNFWKPCQVWVSKSHRNNFWYYGLLKKYHFDKLSIFSILFFFPDRCAHYNGTKELLKYNNVILFRGALSIETFGFCGKFLLNLLYYDLLISNSVKTFLLSYNYIWFIWSSNIVELNVYIFL